MASEALKPPVTPTTIGERIRWIPQGVIPELRERRAARLKTAEEPRDSIEAVAQSLFSLDSLTDTSLQEMLIRQDGTLYVKPNGEPKLARDYLLYVQLDGQSIPESTVDKIVDNESKLKFHISDERMQKILNMDSEEEAGLAMIDELAPLYEINHFCLYDSIQREENGRKYGTDGMNEHRTDHAKHVVREAFKYTNQLLNAWGITDKAQRHHILLLSTMAAAGHDVGQLLTRNGQEQASIALLKRVAPYLFKGENEAFGNKIAHAILIHPEATITRLLGNRTSEEKINLLKELPIADIALILADKWDIRPGRIPKQAKHRYALIRDFNVAINLGFTTTKAAYEDYGRRFAIQLDFNSGIEEENFGELNEDDRAELFTDTKHDPRGTRIKQPGTIHWFLEHHKASHSEVMEAMMWRQYRKRLELAIEAAFTNPLTEKVTFTISDPHAKEPLKPYFRGRRGQRRIARIQEHTYTFHRNDVDEVINFINEGFRRQGIDLDDITRRADERRPKADSQIYGHEHVVSLAA